MCKLISVFETLAQLRKTDLRDVFDAPNPFLFPMISSLCMLKITLLPFLSNKKRGILKQYTRSKAML
jgi:hypothetical protein